MERQLSQREKKVLGILSIVIFVLFTFCVFIFIGIPLIKTARNPETFRQWIEAKGIWGKLAYVGICFLQVLVAIIPGGPIEIAGGYAFGHVEATVLSTIGLSLGSVAVFLLVRRFGRSLLEVFFPKEKIDELKFLRTNKRRDAIILLLFLLPGTPKDLLCFFCGLTDMPFWFFFIVSTFCRIPAAWISSIGGNAMMRKSYLIAVIIALIIVFLSLFGIFAYRKMIRRHNSEKDDENNV